MRFYKMEVCIVEDLDNNVIYSVKHLNSVNDVRRIIENLDWLSTWLSFTYEVTIVKYYEVEDVDNA